MIGLMVAVGLALVIFSLAWYAGLWLKMRLDGENRKKR